MQDLMTVIWPLTWAVIAAIFYVFGGYLKNAGEKPDRWKAVWSLVVGAGAGFYLWWFQIPVDESNVFLLLATYAGIISYFEDYAKGILRRFGIVAWFDKMIGS